MEILKIKGITKDFGGLRTLDNVDIDVHQNEIVGLIGPNGSGKTTLVNVITGFLPPTSGGVIYKGESITGLKPYEIARRGVVRTFQLTSVFPNLTVEENIITAMHLKTSSSALGSFFHTASYIEEEGKLRRKAGELLSFLGMEEQRDVLAGNLPFGGERKLEIAIALAAEPETLLMDEPASGMNPEEQIRLMNLIRLISKQMGITMVIIEHNMKVIMGLCTSIVVLNYGVKLVEGTPDEIAHNEEVISVYLGKSHHLLG